MKSVERQHNAKITFFNCDSSSNSESFILVGYQDGFLEIIDSVSLLRLFKTSHKMRQDPVLKVLLFANYHPDANCIFLSQVTESPGFLVLRLHLLVTNSEWEEGGDEMRWTSGGNDKRSVQIPK
jgi:hypothetical protein